MALAFMSSNQRPRKLWWFFGLLVFVLFALLQMPAAWIVDKFAPKSPYIQHVSGNLWQGSLIWQLPTIAQSTTRDTSQSPLTGSATWIWQPWQLVMAKIGADVEVSTGQTRLAGQVKIAQSSWQLDGVHGKIVPETLSHIADWQLPNTPIQVNELSLQRQFHQGADTSPAGFIQADGQLTWVGGEVGYPSGGKMFHLTIPALRAQFSHEQKNNQNFLHIHLLNHQDQRLGDLYLDGDNMLDVSLTQRLLETMPEYKGQAPQDTPVVSVRQPLLAGLGTR